MALPNPRALSLWILVALAAAVGAYFYTRPRNAGVSNSPPPIPAATAETLIAPGDAESPDTPAAGDADAIEDEGAPPN